MHRRWTAGGGAGLGLALSWAIAESHGGTSNSSAPWPRGHLPTLSPRVVHGALLIFPITALPPGSTRRYPGRGRASSGGLSEPCVPPARGAEGRIDRRSIPPARWRSSG